MEIRILMMFHKLHTILVENERLRRMEFVDIDREIEGQRERKSFSW